MQGFAGGYFLNYRDFDFLTLFPLCVHSRSDHLINLAPMEFKASKTSKISSLERSLEKLQIALMSSRFEGAGRF